MALELSPGLVRAAGTTRNTGSSPPPGAWSSGSNLKGHRPLSALDVDSDATAHAPTRARELTARAVERTSTAGWTIWNVARVPRSGNHDDPDFTYAVATPRPGARHMRPRPGHIAGTPLHHARSRAGGLGQPVPDPRGPQCPARPNYEGPLWLDSDRAG